MQVRLKIRKIDANNELLTPTVSAFCYRLNQYLYRRKQNSEICLTNLNLYAKASKGRSLIKTLSSLLNRACNGKSD